MVMRKKALFLMLLLSFLTSAGARSDILFNGTHVYLATGESATLYQGYVLTFKSVSSDGSMWFQLKDNETIIKNEIVYPQGSMEYNRKNRTIISLKVENVYSGPSEQSLVSFFLYQFNDPEKPFPDKTIMPENTIAPNNNTPPKARPGIQPLILVSGIALIYVLFYFLRKLW